MKDIGYCLLNSAIKNSQSNYLYRLTISHVLHVKRDDFNIARIRGEFYLANFISRAYYVFGFKHNGSALNCSSINALISCVRAQHFIFSCGEFVATDYLVFGGNGETVFCVYVAFYLIK